MVWFWKTTNRKIAPAPSLLDADLMHEEQDERFRDTTNLSRAAERDAQLAGISPALFYKIDDTIRSLSPEEAYSASDILNNFLYRWIAESNGDGVHALICSRVIDLLQSRLREIQERSEDLRNQPLGVGTHIWTYVVTFFSNKKERPIHGQIHDDRLQMRFLKGATIPATYATYLTTSHCPCTYLTTSLIQLYNCTTKTPRRREENSSTSSN
jgi:hypothetical protein